MPSTWTIIGKSSWVALRSPDAARIASVRSASCCRVPETGLPPTWMVWRALSSAARSVFNPREPVLRPPGLPDWPGGNWLCLGGLP